MAKRHYGSESCHRGHPYRTRAFAARNEQVYREIAAPKLRNLKRAGLVIFIFSVLFTSLVSFFAVMIIPESERSKYFDNLISGISMFLAGSFGVKLAGYSKLRASCALHG